MAKGIEKYKEVRDKNIDKVNKSRKKYSEEKLIDGLTKEGIAIRYAYLVKYLAKKLHIRLPANVEEDDLISAGAIGLMDAADKYDSSRENKFKTYAEFRIKGAMLDELRSQDWVPRSVREKAKNLERTFIRIEQKKGRQATEEEVCSELKISKKEYQSLLYEVRSVSLLNFDDIHSLKKSDKKSILNFIDEEKASNPFLEVSRVNVKSIIEKAIGRLPEKQRLVLSLYYYEGLSLKEIGEILDVTESRISQLHTQAIIRLKAKLKSKFEELAQFFY